MEGLKNVFPLWASRIALERTSAEVCLIRYPAAPSSITCSTYASSPCAERTRTLVVGTALRIRRVASRPLSSGIAMSMTTTAGRSALVSFTAWRPVSASPTTWMSPSDSRRARSPSRTTLWSSASSTVIGFIPMNTRVRACGGLLAATERNLRSDGGALSRLRLDVETAADHLHALSHAEQPQSPDPLGDQQALRVKGPAVVVYFHPNEALDPLNIHVHQAGVRMLGDIGECFLGHAVE